ncbi:hypothetical protein FA15DRAFT_167551 [Coprinopsis marcescibilis]|uniref:Uncharacterized protein n=1 Tax=Coprinopsis marcescibilis TaxID=230819 RepID=A0A5C3KUN7_COPMA|nr:hypothetical protein FA15DRAFT_167551 [Coprinopsis marcescibilis]
MCVSRFSPAMESSAYTLPPLYIDEDFDKIATTDEDHPDYWLHGQCAGGWILDFGKHRGQALNSVSVQYLTWCYETLNDKPCFDEAFERYREGLEEWTEDHYMDFVVTFGVKYPGKILEECQHDEEWMDWLTQQPHLRKKHDIFYMALDRCIAEERGRHRYHRRTRSQLYELSDPVNYDNYALLRVFFPKYNL